MENILEPEKQKKLKKVSTFIFVLAMIGKILTRIAVIFVILGITMAMMFVSKLDIKSNSEIEIKNGDSVVLFKIDDNKIKVAVDGKEDAVGDLTPEEVSKIQTFLNNNSKTKLQTYLAVAGIISVAVLIINSIVLQKLEEIFINIHDNKIFIYQNVDNFNIMASLMISSFVIDLVGSIILNLIIKTKGLEISIVIELMQLLFIYAMKYIFEYGTKLREKAEENIVASTQE